MYAININATNNQCSMCYVCTWVDISNVINELCPIHFTGVKSMSTYTKCIMYVTTYTVDMDRLNIHTFVRMECRQFQKSEKIHALLQIVRALLRKVRALLQTVHAHWDF